MVIISRPWLPRELGEFGHACHGAVLVHDFADDAGGRQPGDAGEIDRGLGVAGAHEHAARPRAQRKHVPGAREISRLRRRIDGRPNRPRPDPRRRSRCWCRPSPRCDTHIAVSRRDELSATSSGISSASSRSGVIGQADQPAPVPRHEVDGLRRHLRRRHRQVAFVLAILVVDDDDHLTGAECLQRVVDPGERGPAASRPWPASDAVLVMSVLPPPCRPSAERRTCRSRRPRRSCRRPARAACSEVCVTREGNDLHAAPRRPAAPQSSG